MRYFKLIGAVITALAFASLASCVGLQHAASSGKGIKCTLEKLQDNQRSGLAAFTVFVPAGWKSNNVFRWNPDNSYNVAFFASTPDNQYIVHVDAPQNLKYVAGTGIAPAGVLLNSATDYIHSIIDLIRGQGATDIQVDSESQVDLPLESYQKQLQGMAKFGNPSTYYHQSAFTKISFMFKGSKETASLGTTVSATVNANHTTLGIGPTAKPWYSEHDFYVVGPTVFVMTPLNPSPARVKEAQILVSSPSITPQFSLFCAKMRNQMAANALHQTEQNGIALRQQMEDHRSEMMSEFKTRMADRDANSHDFCNYILDQQDYKSRDGTTVTIPYMYNHSYENGQGEYILNSDPTFDPRGGRLGTLAENDAWAVVELNGPKSSG